MSKLSKFASFLGKYSDEAMIIAGAFRSLSTRFMEHSEKEAIDRAIDSFERTSTNIKATLKDVDEAMQVRISPAELKKAVREAMPELIADAVKSALETERAQAKEA